MKIRSGFVSNSSSSSFIVATKDGADVRQIVLDAFKVSKKSPIYHVIEDAADVMVNADKYTLKQLCEEMYVSLEELYEEHPALKKAVDKGFKHFYYGSASDDTGEIAETLLCDLDIHYMDDKVMIEKEGGY